MLLKTTTVLELHGFDGGDEYVWFDNTTHDAPDKFVKVSKRTWQHMGEPQRVTVTIEAGDVLNNHLSDGARVWREEAHRKWKESGKLESAELQ